MKIICAKDYNDMSRKAANLLSSQVIIKENSVLGLATGGTVLGIYKQLIEWYEKGDVDFSSAHSINLDEYVGLSPEDPNSYHYFMNQNFFNHVNFSAGHCHLPNGMASSIMEECQSYDCLIEKLCGIDMQLLGLGTNGHIGFNEPHQAFEKKTHCVTLSESTRKTNARFFASPDAVPTHAITMGIKSIMLAKRIVLCVSGESKAKILRDVLFGPVTPAVPGSILQMHPQLIVVADTAARHCLPKEYSL